MTDQIKGACLCGGVQFTVALPSVASAHCHCAYCRLSSGAPVVTWVVIPEPRFEITTGADKLTWYQSSLQSRRGFCSVCGSTMLFTSTLCPGEVHVTRANLTGAVDREPAFHCFFDHRVPWLKFSDDLKILDSTSPELVHYQQVQKPDEHSGDE